MRLFFDIETMPDTDKIGFLPPVTAPANYKDAEKIEAYITEKSLTQVSEMALDPDHGKIAMFSVSKGDGIATYTWLPGDYTGLNVKTVSTEKELITEFWKLAAKFEGLIGYNILGFDIPYLYRRSMALRTPGVIKYNLAKFRVDRLVDLMAILYNWGQAKGLKRVRDIYGLTDLYHDLKELTGADFATLTPEMRVKYSQNDIHLTKQLYKLMETYYDLGY